MRSAQFTPLQVSDRVIEVWLSISNTPILAITILFNYRIVHPSLANVIVQFVIIRVRFSFSGAWKSNEHNEYIADASSNASQQTWLTPCPTSDADAQHCPEIPGDRNHRLCRDCRNFLHSYWTSHLFRSIPFGTAWLGVRGMEENLPLVWVRYRIRFSIKSRLW